MLCPAGSPPFQLLGFFCKQRGAWLQRNTQRVPRFWCVLMHFFSSSPQTVLGKPQCLPVSMPCLEESQASEHSQVRECIPPTEEKTTVHEFWSTIPLQVEMGDVEVWTSFKKIIMVGYPHPPFWAPPTGSCPHKNRSPRSHLSCSSWTSDFDAQPQRWGIF